MRSKRNHLQNDLTITCPGNWYQQYSAKATTLCHSIALQSVAHAPKIANADRRYNIHLHPRSWKNTADQLIMQCNQFELETLVIMSGRTYDMRGTRCFRIAVRSVQVNSSKKLYRLVFGKWGKVNWLTQMLKVLVRSPLNAHVRATSY